jgi:CBS domain-containing protein
MSIKSDVRHAKRQAVERLLALRDETKLQLHLLSLDARKRWDGLEKEIVALEERASREGEKAAEALVETANELTRNLNELMARQVNHSVGLLTSVSSLMATHVRTCRPDEPLSRAAQLMWETDCGVVPVVEQHEVVGLVTDRDICMATYTQGKPPEALRVDSAMSKEVFSCLPDDSIGAALTNMGAKRVRRLPVMNAERRLLGLISLADVIRWARPLDNPAVDAALTDALAAISARTPQKFQAAAE